MKKKQTTITTTRIQLGESFEMNQPQTCLAHESTPNKETCLAPWMDGRGKLECR